MRLIVTRGQGELETRRKIEGIDGIDGIDGDKGTGGVGDKEKDCKA